jgi:hypothetical protein
MAARLQAPRLFNPRPRSRPALAPGESGRPRRALWKRSGRARCGRDCAVGEPGGPDRAAGFVIARAALASGSAWLYAWYGDDIEAAPANHDMMVLGPQSALDPRLMAAAPAEVRAATSAAANRTPRRHLGSTAFASDDTQRNARITGVAALFEQADGRRGGAVHRAGGADFARAAKRLARSELWIRPGRPCGGLGQLGGDAFGPSAAPRFSAEWAAQMVRTHDEYLRSGRLFRCGAAAA